MSETLVCIECGDQRGFGTCDQCKDVYCEVCFGAQHRRGRRARHVLQPFEGMLNNQQRGKAGAAPAPATHSVQPMTDEASQPLLVTQGTYPHAAAAASGAPHRSYADATTTAAQGTASAATSTKRRRVTVSDKVAQMLNQGQRRDARYVPLRLTDVEKQELRMAEAVLNTCEYTDNVDILSHESHRKRVLRELIKVVSATTGLAIAANYRTGRALVKRGFVANAGLFAHIFEVARRHKVRNPAKMRTGYGKLIYLLMDSVDPDVGLNISLVTPIRTVQTLLHEKNAMHMLEDPLLQSATMEILSMGRSRAELDALKQKKVAAMEALVAKYVPAAQPQQARGGQQQLEEVLLTADDVKLVVASIGDSRSFLSSNHNPIMSMLMLLQNYFRPGKSSGGSDPLESLAIMSGRGGARLSHGHNAQYHYVRESLLLWAEVVSRMYKLWLCAEEDLLEADCGYRLRNTGQGLNRVQRAGRVGREMSSIISTVSRHLPGQHFVGSTVVHLGDSNVPNALMFIDKYNQCSRICAPIVHTIERIDVLYGESEDMKNFFDKSFGGAERCKRLILHDFFRHGFDGSGADNYFDAGSCIDGRLTSAWNWCSKIAKKSYYPVFQLCGFIGFDGQWS